MQPHPSATDLPEVLAKLCDAGVEFIIVGGAAEGQDGAANPDRDAGGMRQGEGVAISRHRPASAFGAHEPWISSNPRACP